MLACLSWHRLELMLTCACFPWRRVKLMLACACLSWRRVLSLAGNRFNSTVPASFGSMTSLSALNISDNLLYGEMPQELSRLTALQYVLACWSALAPCVLHGDVSLFHFRRFFASCSNNFVGSLPQFLPSIAYDQIECLRDAIDTLA